MKNLTALLLLSIFTTVAFSQTFDEKKTYIKENYSAIEKELTNYSKKEYQELTDGSYPPVTYYTFWFNAKNQLVKAMYSVGEEGYGTEKSFYFDKEKLFFVYTENISPDPESNYYQPDSEQFRCYYYQEELFDCLVKNIKATDKRKYIPNEKYTGKISEIAKKELIEAKQLFETAKKSK